MNRSKFNAILLKLQNQLVQCSFNIEGFNHLIIILKDLSRSLSILNEKQKILIIEFLLNCLQLCAQNMQALKRKIRVERYLIAYLADLDRPTLLDCIKNCLKLIKTLDLYSQKNILLESAMLFKNIYQLTSDTNIQKELLLLIGKAGMYLDEAEKKIIISLLNSIVNFPNRNRDTEILIQAAKAAVLCLSSGNINNVILWLKSFFIPLLKDNEFCIVAIRCEENSSHYEPFTIFLMRLFTDPKQRKAIVLFLMSELNNQNSEVRRMVAILFSAPEKYKIPLSSFNHDELRDIQNNLHNSIIKIERSDDQAREYVRNLFKLEETLVKREKALVRLCAAKSYVEASRISFMLDFVIKFKHNPVILNVCLEEIKKEIRLILLFNGHAVRLLDLIKRLFILICHSNEDVRDSAFELLQILSYEPSLKFIQKNELYIAYRDKREENLKNIMTQIQNSSLSKKDAIKAKFDSMKSTNVSIKSLLKFLLEEILKAKDQDQAELILRFSSDDYFHSEDYVYSQDDNEDRENKKNKKNKKHFLANPEVITFFCNIYMRCEFSYLKYVAMENLIYSIKFLYKKRRYINSDIIRCLANLKIRSEYSEIIEQIISFFDMVTTELPELKNCALLCLEKLLLNNPHFILIKRRADALPFVCVNNNEQSSKSETEQVNKHKQAMKYFLMKQYENAIGLYKSLLEIISDSDSLLYLIELAHCHWQANHKDEAKRIFDFVVDHYSCYGYAHFQRGVFLFETGLDYQQSENDLIKASELNDFYAPIYYYRALISERVHHDISAAISHLDMALTMRPAFRQAIDRKIELYYRESDYVMARIAYHEAQLYFSNFSEFSEQRALTIVQHAELMHIPYAEEFNYISTLIKKIDDPFWGRVKEVLILAQKIMDESAKFISDDILEDCNAHYPLQEIGKEDMQPHERYRFICDFISLVIRRTVWFEFHQRYRLFQDKSERINLLNLVCESQVGSIFNEKRPAVLLERLSQYCAVYSMHDFLKKYLVSTETRDGYAVGITKDLAKTYSIFPRILGLHHWEAAYGMYNLAAENAHTDHFFRSILATNKKVIFFVPTAIGNEVYKEKVTYEEVAWVANSVRECPEILKNLIIVFDAYNFLPLYLLSRQFDEESLAFDAEKLLEEVKQFLLNYVVTAQDHAIFMEIYHKNIHSYLNRNIKGFLLSQLNYSAGQFSYQAANYNIRFSDFINALREIIVDIFNSENLPLSDSKIADFYAKFKKYIEPMSGSRERYIQRKIVFDFIFKLFADRLFSNYINPGDKHLNEIIYFLENAQDIIADVNGRRLMTESLMKLIKRYENVNYSKLKEIIKNIKELLKSSGVSDISEKEVNTSPPQQPIALNYKKNQPILFFKLNTGKISLNDAKTRWISSVNQLIETFNNYSLSIVKVRHGLFSGEIPRHLREMKYQIDQIFKLPDEANVALENMAKIIRNHGNFRSMLKLISQCQQAFLIYEETKSKAVYYQIFQSCDIRS